MMKNMLVIASAALAATLAIPAQAGQIFIAGTASFGTVKFTAEPLSSLRVSAPLGFDGNATYVPDMGPTDTASVQFGTLDFFTGPESAGVFTAIPPSDQTFNYESNLGGVDQLTAEITWTQVVANAPLPGEPELVGTAFIQSSSGDPSFMTDDFPAGSTINITAKFPLGGGCDLTQLATMVDCTATFEFASFEGTDALTPGTPPLPPVPPLVETPEPMSSLLGLGIALFCLWGAYLVTRREPGQATS